MGHVESGGAAGGAAQKLTEHAAWPVWRRLRSLFPAWTLLWTSFTTPGAWGWFGNDVLTGFRKNPSTDKAFQLLARTPPQIFDSVSALASLNLRRQELGFQVIIVFYVTIPVTAFIGAGEIAPERLIPFVERNADFLRTIFFALVASTLYYLMCLWRARQMVQVVDLVRIERGIAPLSTVELRGDL